MKKLLLILAVLGFMSAVALDDPADENQIGAPAANPGQMGAPNRYNLRVDLRGAPGNRGNGGGAEPVPENIVPAVRHLRGPQLDAAIAAAMQAENQNN